MNFNFQVSEQDFREAQRVYGKYTLRRRTVSKIILWAEHTVGPFAALEYSCNRKAVWILSRLLEIYVRYGWHLLLGHGHLKNFR